MWAKKSVTLKYESESKKHMRHGKTRRAVIKMRVLYCHLRPRNDGSVDIHLASDVGRKLSSDKQYEIRYQIHEVTVTCKRGLKIEYKQGKKIT